MSDALGDYVDACARALGLPLAPEHRAGVVANFARLAEAAEAVDALVLPADVEPAPRFGHD